MRSQNDDFRICDNVSSFSETPETERPRRPVSRQPAPEERVEPARHTPQIPSLLWTRPSRPPRTCVGRRRSQTGRSGARGVLRRSSRRGQCVETREPHYKLAGRPDHRARKRRTASERTNLTNQTPERVFFRKSLGFHARDSPTDAPREKGRKLRNSAHAAPPLAPIRVLVRSPARWKILRGPPPQWKFYRCGYRG